MTHISTRRVAAAVLAAVFILTMTMTGFAEQRPSSSTDVLASGRSHVQQLVNATPPRRAAAAQQAAGGYDEPSSFFRSKRGMALLVLAGAGIGYMWYSKSNDRIHSTARARLDN